jgi:hypothetical protein
VYHDGEPFAASLVQRQQNGCTVGARRRRCAIMKSTRRLIHSAVVATVLVATPSAWAFGGSANELSHQGNFVVTNDANFGFSKPFNTAETSFLLQPALHYMVIDHLSVGGAVGFQVYDNGHGLSGFSFDLRPYVGYELALSDTWSFWPRAFLDINPVGDNNGIAGAPPPNRVNVSIGIQAPFLIHPAPHFFFGIYPQLSTMLSDSTLPTGLGGGFLIGGYFDS